MAKLRYYLLLDHIVIHGANAISSPLTYGFPAIGGFLGAMHALSRNITAQEGEQIYLDGVMIACHQCDVQIYRPHDFADYTFKLTRNPIGKDGKTRSIIEEGKVHLEVSLVVEVICSRNAINEDNQQAVTQQIRQKLLQQRIAGGSVQSIGFVTLYQHDEDKQAIINQLLPAFVLTNAQQELQQITAQLQSECATATMLDALIETAKLHHIPQTNNQWRTHSVKTGRGWLVPIAIGYQAISPLFAAGTVAYTRDNDHPSQFVECIYGLAKWQFPLHLYQNFESAFWRYHSASKQSNGAELYLIDQEYTDD